MPKSEVINEGNKLFIAEGFVSAEGDDANQRPVKIFGDMG